MVAHLPSKPVRKNNYVKYVERLLSEVFDAKSIARMRSQIDRNLETYAEDEYIQPLVAYLGRARDGDLCLTDDDNKVAAHALELLFALAVINAYDRGNWSL